MIQKILITLTLSLFVAIIAAPAPTKAIACTEFSENFEGGLDGAIWRANGNPSINNDELLTTTSNAPVVSEIITNEAFSGDSEIRVTVNSFNTSMPVNGNYSVLASLGMVMDDDHLVAVYWEKYFNVNYISIGIKEGGNFHFVDGDITPANNDEVTLTLTRKGNQFTGRVSLSSGANGIIGTVTSNAMNSNSLMYNFIHSELTNAAPNGFTSNIRYDDFVFSCTTTETPIGVDALPIYRFWSDAKQTHFYTITAEERDTVIATYPTFIWKYEGAVFGALEYTGSCATNYSPVYRFWSDRLQRHFYTIDETEKDSVIANLSATWNRFEGPRFCAAKSQLPSSLPIYRFWSDQLQSHFYTINEPEKDNVLNNLSNTWNHPEGVRYYAYPL